MMKKILAAGLLTVLATEADAKSPEEWKEHAINVLPAVTGGVIRSATLGKNDKIFVTVEKKSGDWSSDRSSDHEELCRILIKIGYPERSKINIIYTYSGILSFPFAEKFCYPKIERPKGDEPSEELGFVGDDGVVRTEAENDAYEAAKAAKPAPKRR